MKRFGLAFPSETFETVEEAIKAASAMVIEDEITQGVYVFDANHLIHVKLVKSAVATEVKQ